MKKLLLIALLAASNAHSAVLCQSVSDPNFQMWFGGYTCPPGYILIRTK